MKNQNHKTINGSGTNDAGTPSSVKAECCPCCLFLKAWLARRKQRSEDDLAAAILIHLLWATKDADKVEGLCGLAFHEGNLDPIGIAVPDEALKGLRILEDAGLLDIYLCEEEPANEALGLQAPPRSTALAVDLLWLKKHQGP